MGGSARRLFALWVCAAALGACTTQRSEEGREPVTFEEAQAVLERHREEWMSLPGVSGIGLGRCDGEPCIRIYVERDTAAVRDRIPPRIDGVQVRPEVTGPFRTHEPPPD